MATNGSAPSTHAWCPAGIVYDMPGTIVVCVPSFILIVMRPETAYPTWGTWHDSVLTTGLTHSDHRHPGCSVNRPIVNPSSRTTSTLVLSGARTSSGVAWDFV